MRLTFQLQPWPLRNATLRAMRSLTASVSSNATCSMVLSIAAQQAAPLLGNTTPNAEAGSRNTGHGSRLFDLIASNPPYIGRREAATLMREVRDHEPEIALYGGEEGYELYAGLITQAAAHLKPSGILVLELGHNSLPAVQPLLDAPTWANVGEFE